MLNKIRVEADVIHDALRGESLELVVRRAERRRARFSGGHIRQLDEATTVNALVRSTADGFTGCAVLSRSDQAGLAWAVRQARALRQFSRTPLEQPEMAGEPAVVSEVAASAFAELCDMDGPTTIALLRDLAARAEAEPGVIRADVAVSQVAELVTVTNSAGLDITYPRPEMTLTLNVIVRDDNRSGRCGITVRAPSEMDYAALCTQAVAEAQAGTGRHARGDIRPAAIVIAPRAWVGLFGQLAAAFYGDRPDLTRSNIRVLGNRVLRPGFDLIDDGTDAGRLAAVPCDDEGTPSRRTAVVADGLLQTLLHDRSSPERAIGEKSTANGWMVPSGAGHGIAVSGSMLRLDGHAVPLDKLLRLAEPLFYINRVEDGSGRGVDALNGSVRLTVSGWLVRCGEPAESVKRAFIGMSLREFLLHLGATSDVAEYYRLAAGSTIRRGPAVRSTHVLFDDIPVTIEDE